MPKDNSTLKAKASLRAGLLKHIPDPFVIETHGGYGGVHGLCYRHIPHGIVIEKQEAKAEVLAANNPGWSVFCGDSEKLLSAGLGAHVPCNFLDVDPYGDPWPTIEGFLFSRPLPDLVGIAVNDGLRHKLKRQGGWAVESISEAVREFGNERLYRDYAEVCRWNMSRLAVKVGLTLDRWAAYYCGDKDAMTHYAALLRR